LKQDAVIIRLWETGLGYVLQIRVLHRLWNIFPAGANSRSVWANVNKCLQGGISRTSVIIYLNHMVDEALLNYTETMSIGGRQRVYYMKYGETELKQHMAKLIILKLFNEYPEATRKALLNLDV
jgi:predicted transcriptional regulator